MFGNGTRRHGDSRTDESQAMAKRKDDLAVRSTTKLEGPARSDTLRGAVMDIVDSQVHLWEADRSDRPWPRDRPSSRPQREVPLGPIELLPLMDATGVDRAVVVPPMWATDDNASAIEWSQHHPNRLGIMGRFDLWADNRERIETFLEQPGMLGIRMSVPRERGSAWIDDPNEVAWFWAAAERLQIPIMLFTSKGVRGVDAIAERYPTLRIILDHLGLPLQPRPDASTDEGSDLSLFWDFDSVLNLARYPNVSAKLSCLPFYTNEPYPYTNLTSHLQRTYDLFGPKRLMWGSDFTRLRNGTYQQCLDHVRNLEFLTDEDREWILGRSILEVLNWV
jgi:predicted TIM-barrel fold metal-dependent hydrolase